MKPFLIIFGIFLLLAGVGVGIYFYLKRNPPNDDDPAASTEGGNSAISDSSLGASSASTGKELQKGSSGADVKTLQGLINKTINAVRAVSPNNVPAAISEDGNFGAKTESALQFCTGKKTATLANYAALVSASSKSNRTDLTPQQKQAMSQVTLTTSGNSGSGTIGFINNMFGLSESEGVALYNAAQQRDAQCKALAEKSTHYTLTYEACKAGRINP